MGDCTHNFQFQGTYAKAGSSMAGTGARVRRFFDRYYCTQCLQTVDRNERTNGNTYEPLPVGVVYLEREA